VFSKEVIGLEDWKIGALTSSAIKDWKIFEHHYIEKEKNCMFV
jgi:hypothetical protein